MWSCAYALVYYGRADISGQYWPLKLDRVWCVAFHSDMIDKVQFHYRFVKLINTAISCEEPTLKDLTSGIKLSRWQVIITLRFLIGESLRQQLYLQFIYLSHGWKVHSLCSRKFRLQPLLLACASYHADFSLVFLSLKGPMWRFYHTITWVYHASTETPEWTNPTLTQERDFEM